MRPSELIQERFLLEKIIGRGGMGVVWQCLDQKTGQRVAVKELSLTDNTARQRFAQEAWLLSQLSHPNIVRHIAHGETESGELFFVMEWLDGEDLAARLSRGPLSETEAMSIVLQLAESLSHAHQKGLIHRDLKPSNLFLVGDHVKLVDFGIARQSELDYDMTRTGVMIGTPGYMAPEQASRGAKGLTSSADIFSVGCILFEALSGQRAFEGDSVLAILSKILLHQPPRLEDIGVSVSPMLSQLIQQMLSKDPAARPQSGAALLSLLQRGSVQPAAPQESKLTLQEQRYFAMLLIEQPSSLTDTKIDASAPTIAAGVSPLLNLLRSRVELFQGKLTQLIEGSILISFQDAGSASALATRAARCALALRDLTTSPIVLSFGRAEQVRQIFIGDAIDRAVSLLKSARDIIIDPTAASLLETNFVLKAEQNLSYLLQERSSPRARTLLGRSAPCVGRERELTLLEATFQQCVDEETTRTLLLVAPAGVGKSRLREEFLHRIEGQSYLLLQCHGDTLREGSPFALISEALRGYFSIKTSDSQEEAQSKIVTTLRERLPGALSGGCHLFLGELVGARFSDRDSPELQNARNDAALLGDQMRRFFVEWLYAERSRQPILFLLEDLHWGDQPTISYLESARVLSPDGPLMILATARPEVHQTFGDFWQSKEEIKLAELSKKASERLIRAALGESINSETAQRLIAISSGNAFYLEELIRAVSQGRSGELPETVLAMATARLEILSPEARRVLRAASIFGERSWHSAIASLAPGSSLSQVLQELRNEEVLLSHGEGCFAGQEEFSFRHALLREATYATLTQQDKLLGHRLAAQWLEQNKEPDARVLAGHWEKGGELASAVSCYLRAAEQALEGNDLKGVLDCTNRAIQCGASGEELGRAHLIAAEALNWQGDFLRAIQDAREALALFPKGEHWFRAAGELALAAARMGILTDLRALYQEIRHLNWQRPLSTSQLLFAARLATTLQRHSLRNESIDIVKMLRPFIEEDALDLRGQAWLQILLAMEDFLNGNPADWYHRLHKSASLFSQAGDQRNTCTNLSDCAFVLMVLGDTHNSISIAQQAIQIAEKLQTARVTAMCTSTLGVSLSIAKRYQESIPHLKRAIQFFTEQNDLAMKVSSLVALGTAHTELGAHREAWAIVEQIPQNIAASFSLQRALLAANLYLREEKHAEIIELLAPLQGMSFPPWIELAFGEFHRALYANSLWHTGRREEARAISIDVHQNVLRFANTISDQRLRESLLQRREYAYALQLYAEFFASS